MKPEWTINLTTKPHILDTSLQARVNLIARLAAMDNSNNDYRARHVFKCSNCESNLKQVARYDKLRYKFTTGLIAVQAVITSQFN